MEPLVEKALFYLSSSNNTLELVKLSVSVGLNNTIVLRVMLLVNKSKIFQDEQAMLYTSTIQSLLSDISSSHYIHVHYVGSPPVSISVDNLSQQPATYISLLSLVLFLYLMYRNEILQKGTVPPQTRDTTRYLSMSMMMLYASYYAHAGGDTSKAMCFANTTLPFAACALYLT
jgi:hypothetical protein